MKKRKKLEKLAVSVFRRFGVSTRGGGGGGFEYKKGGDARREF